MKSAESWNDERWNHFSSGTSCTEWIKKIQADASKSSLAEARPWVELLNQFIQDGYIVLDFEDERPFADILAKVRSV